MRGLVDHYSHLDSVFHTWHPTFKWISYGIVSLAVATVDTGSVAAVCLVVSLLFVRLANLPLRLVFSRFLALSVMFVIFTVMLAFTVSPHDASLGFINYSAEGLCLGVLIGLKCMTIVVLTVILLATTSMARLFKSLGDFFIPARLIEILLLVYRLIYSVSGEMESLRRAATCRGYKPSISFLQLKTFGKLTGSLLIRGFERSDRLYDAMLVRGYDGTVRTMSETKPGVYDYVKTSIAVAFAGLLFAVRVWF